MATVVTVAAEGRPANVHIVQATGNETIHELQPGQRFTHPLQQNEELRVTHPVQDV